MERELTARGLRRRTAAAYAYEVRAWRASGQRPVAYLMGLPASRVARAHAGLRWASRLEGGDLLDVCAPEVCAEVFRRNALSRLDHERARPPLPSAIEALRARLGELPAHARRAADLALHLGLFAGLRRGDLLSLRWADVDLARGRLVLPDPKGGRPYLVPLCPTLRLVLTRHRRAAGPVVEVGGAALSPATLNRWLARLGVRPHDLRRGFATGLLSRGVPVPDVARLMNHKSTTTTLAYHCPDVDTLAAAVAALEKETP